ncbi:MAG: auxin-responsive promoter family protein [Thermoproteota archaeon]|nr:auxin-responsive promoter family protein [Thermoproteota archaeon]
MHFLFFNTFLLCSKNLRPLDSVIENKSAIRFCWDIEWLLQLLGKKFKNILYVVLVRGRAKLISKLLGNPSIGKMILNFKEGRVFEPYEVSVEVARKKQEESLSRKFARMEKTGIGKKLGVNQRTKLEEIPVTDYNFYEGFFRKPSADAFMYPLEEYERARTSGTSGAEKWFMIPKLSLVKCWETGFVNIMAMFHDGEKITFRYGDVVYVNVAPQPFVGGFMLDYAGRETYGIIKLVPNLNLSFSDKIQFFIRNYDKLDGAVMLASTLVSQIMHQIDGTITLKGLITLDSQIAEMYTNKIRDFTGILPKTIYGTTETLNCTISSVQYPLGFFFDWKRGIFEFCPAGKDEPQKMSSTNLTSLDKVEVGKIYNLIFTSLEGELTRYLIDDTFQCIARRDDVLSIDFPIFKFSSRFGKRLSIQNFTRIDEAELLSALRDINVSFIDFTARVEEENGSEYLALYLEKTGPISEKELKQSLNDILYKVDVDYRNVVDFFGYIPIKIYFVPRGTFLKYMEEKIASWGKVERINMKQEGFQIILESLKRQE